MISQRLGSEGYKTSTLRLAQGPTLFRTSLVLACLAAILSGCTGLLNGKLFEERAAETPPPQEQIFDKSFFREANGQAKTFACAWAPEFGRGTWGEELLTRLVNTTDHCNLEFEITENYLIGRMVNPSLDGQPQRWKEWVKIPVRKHFYYERDKDQHGRETNRWIENDQRSHWSARPKMTLDLAGIDILDLGREMDSGSGFRISKVSDIEPDPKSGFLGFSLDVVFASEWFGSRAEYQARLRVNFMEFKHDKSFRKIPYHQENSRYMNILHVMGRKLESNQPELYAARWDVRQPVKIYVNGVPRELEKTVTGALNKWNEAFQNAGIVPRGQLAFIPVITKLKNAFDLRYPAINYVSDKRLPSGGTLGVGVATADVRNGKILWGTVTMFGGVLENYINNYTPTTGDGQGNAMKLGDISPIHTILSLLPTSFKAFPPQFNDAARASTAQEFLLNHQRALIDESQSLAARGSTQADLDALREQVNRLKGSATPTNIRAMINHFAKKTNEQSVLAVDYFKGKSVQNLLHSSTMTKLSTALDAANRSGQKQMAELLAEKDLATRQRMVKSLSASGNAFYYEQDLNLERMGGLLMNSPARQKRTYQEMVESVIMHLSLHEFGHMIGLGHQFKENIVPEEGTVPTRYVKAMAELATEENEFAETSTVMGYRSGRTEMMVAADRLKPGAHDELVLRYLYGGQYSTYDPTADDWVFANIPDSGKVPDFSVVKTKNGQSRELKTAYFPQCNDYQASFGMDPFCNRWDRGSKAVDIVKSYFSYISDNLTYNLYSLAGGGSDPEAAEARLWHIALDDLSRVRIFYDEMRRRLRSERHLAPLWEQLRNQPDALMKFSKACQKADPTDPKQVDVPVLRDIFKDAAIVDLCRANALALNEFRFYLNLHESDYTRVNHADNYIAGGFLAGEGQRNWGHVFGSWYQLSNLPLKFASLLNLTTATPYMMWGGWMVPSFAYDYSENHFSYRTLYPTEYTSLIADTVLSNLSFRVNGGRDTTTMGRSILALGGLLPRQDGDSNDSARLPDQFNKLLDQQNSFDYSMVAVLVSAIEPTAADKDVKAYHYKRFTAKIYDFFTGKQKTARDVFVLPRGEVLIWADGMFLFPVTELTFYTEKEAYVIAYKITYSSAVQDDLLEVGVKKKLLAKHNEILEMCVTGFAGNGLISYFGGAGGKDQKGQEIPDEMRFKGFHIPAGIEQDETLEKTTIFYKSIEENFKNYRTINDRKIPAGNRGIQDMATMCSEAVRGVGEISAAAALINGYWLGITSKYLMN